MLTPEQISLIMNLLEKIYTDTGHSKVFEIEAILLENLKVSN